MRLKINISTKFALLAAFVIILLTSILTYSNYEDQQNYFEEKLKKQILLYGQTLDANIGNINSLFNFSKTTQFIKKFMDDNPDIRSIDILLLDVNNNLWISNSNDEEKIGTMSAYTNESYYFIYHCIKNNLSNKGLYIERIENSYDHLAIMPIYVDELETYLGTYELTISMEGDYKNLQIRLNNILQMSIFFLIFILIFIFVIVRIIIQKPINNLKNAANSLRKGNLDIKVDIKSKDEIGELASTFNEMAKDLKESRDKIEDYNKILEKLIDRKDEFIGQLGHDLKNPLQSLIGLLPILINDEEDPEKKESLSIMKNDAEYMQHLIFDTLKLAKLRTDRAEFKFEELNLKDLVNNVIETQKPILKENNIAIENKINADYFVWADELRIKEVFNNLISNSVKYSSGENKKIVIDAEKLKYEVRISVDDNGRGITEEEIGKVFDEFYTADKEMSTQRSTGLGLAISKRIVEKHGGKIRAKSRGKGLGSTFIFTLKIYK